jgi:hypothetical protein
MTASFSPEHLGAGTTIHFGFQIAASGGQVPSPLTGVELFYPANFGIADSDLGLNGCQVAALEADGPSGCPENSRMGYGTALVEVPLGPEIVPEKARLALFSRPVQNERLSVLFYAVGEGPISAEIIIPSFVVAAPAPFGGKLETKLPLVPSVPEGPNASVVRMSSTIGPSHITYYEHVHGRTIPYHPKGILMPQTCPRGGFPFTAKFSFEDGSQAQASTSVPCPPSGGRHRR